MTLEALRGGRPAVLADLLERYGRDMHSVAYLILRDPAAAEDVVAESLLVALEQGKHLREDAALRPWLLRIATNRALRSRQRRSRVVELRVVSELESRERGPDADERAALWQAVVALPPRMRAAVGLRYYLDLPVETVASVLGVSPNTVKTQLKSALVHLRAALADEPAQLGEVRHA
jgi:RNA polymerase sigma-70 factor (ECF subfamily)